MASDIEQITKTNYAELEKKLLEFIEYNKNLTHYLDGKSFSETRPPIWIDIRNLAEEIVSDYPRDIQELTQQIRKEFVEIVVCNYSESCDDRAVKHYYYLQKTNTTYALNNLLSKLDLSNAEIRIRINEPVLLKNVECNALCLYHDYDCFECINSIRKVDKIFVEHSHRQKTEHVPFIIDALDKICGERQIYIEYQITLDDRLPKNFKELIMQCSCVREVSYTNFEVKIIYSCA